MSQWQIVAIDILLEFLEVAFNGILYLRELYPKEIFIKKKIYNIGVHIAEHPEVTAYVKNVLKSISELLSTNEKSIKAINFVFYYIKEEKNITLEKFVFNLFNFRFNYVENDPYFLKTELSLREFYLKLMSTKSYCKKLPEDTLFTIEIETDESGYIGIVENEKCQDFPWITSELNSSDNSEIKNNYLLPISTVKSKYVELQIFRIFNNDIDGTNN